MKTINLLFKILFVCVAMVSCKKDNTPQNQSVDIEIQVSYASEDQVEKLTNESVLVQVFNESKQVVYKGETDAQGTVKVAKLSPGRYSIQATKTYSASEFNTIFDLDEEFDVAFSSALETYEINLMSDKLFKLELRNGSYSPLLIKQIYYVGSHATDGASFRDQFIEIYNNSEDVQFADGLYIAEAHGANSENIQYSYQAISKQYDWSKSFNMPANINANSDFVYARTILQLPGSGNQYPIQPGTSIVIASTAVNHKTPYTGTDGVSITVKNPSLTVDLSTADFEAYYTPYMGSVRPLASDVDNPSVPNVIVHRKFGASADLIMNQVGQQSWFIFRDANMGPVSSWKGYDQPYADGRESTGATYIQIPVSNILDGVEIQSSSTSTVYPKRFTAQVDAGNTAAQGGARSSYSVIRKTKEIVNGRRVLADTNNSTTDFVTIKAEPRTFVD